MANSITGQIYTLTATEKKMSRGGKEYTTREMVLDCSEYDRYTGEKRENFVRFAFFGEEKCARLDNLNVGDLVTVSFIVQGQKLDDGRVFNDLRPIGVELRERRKDATYYDAAAPVKDAPRVVYPQPSSTLPGFPPGDDYQTKDDIPF